MSGKIRFLGLVTLLGILGAVLLLGVSGWAQKGKPPKPPAPPADPAITYVENTYRGKLSGTLKVMNADGSNQRTVLSERGANYSYPEWSPDGKQVAFIRGTGEDIGIYIINVDGTGLRKVYDGGDGDFEGPATWSPMPLADGQHKLAFCYSLRRPDGTYEIEHEVFFVNLDGTGLARLTYGGSGGGYISWSPTADRVTFFACCDPYTGEAGFGVFGIVYSNGTFSLLTLSTCYTFAWGIWANTQDKLISCKNGQYDMWIYDLINPELSYQVTFTGSSSYKHDASWSPGDSKILFVAGPTGQLCIVNASDGSGLTEICPGVDFTWKWPRWRRNP